MINIVEEIEKCDKSIMVVIFDSDQKTIFEGVFRPYDFTEGVRIDGTPCLDINCNAVSVSIPLPLDNADMDYDEDSDGYEFSVAGVTYAIIM